SRARAPADHESRSAHAQRDGFGGDHVGVARGSGTRNARTRLTMRKLAALLGLWLVLLLLALSTGWNAVWVLVYSLGLLLAGSALWANWNVAGLELRRRHRVTRVQVGDTFVEQAILEPKQGIGQWWPRLWLELHDA